MKKYLCVVFLFVFIMIFSLTSIQVSAFLPLTGKIIVVDPGHGGKDPGTSYKNILEKDINLKISLYLEKELSKRGASVILTRDGDYDLSSANAIWRKKSDFDNRIKLINGSNANMYLSIHLNYLDDARYFGGQVFYDKANKLLAQTIQDEFNVQLKGNREIKPMPKRLYMYNKLNAPGVLIECGFLSNYNERNLLNSKKYQRKVASVIATAIVKYYE